MGCATSVLLFQRLRAILGGNCLRVHKGASQGGPGAAEGSDDEEGDQAFSPLGSLLWTGNVALVN
jgi:hypothetical protein